MPKFESLMEGFELSCSQMARFVDLWQQRGKKVAGTSGASGGGLGGMEEIREVTELTSKGIKLMVEEHTFTF